MATLIIIYGATCTKSVRIPKHGCWTQLRLDRRNGLHSINLRTRASYDIYSYLPGASAHHLNVYTSRALRHSSTNCYRAVKCGQQTSCLAPPVHAERHICMLVRSQLTSGTHRHANVAGERHQLRPLVLNCRRLQAARRGSNLGRTLRMRES